MFKKIFLGDQQKNRLKRIRQSELFEEAQVVLEEQANVRDTVLSYREAFDAETESPAGVLFAVDANSKSAIVVPCTMAK